MDLRTEGYAILKCTHLTDDVLEKLNVKVGLVLGTRKQTNVVRNLHDISNWDEFYHVWEAIEWFCKTEFSNTMKDMHFSHKTYGGIMIANAPTKVRDHQKWHRDTDYKSFTVCIPLLQINETNGCTQILPNTIQAPPKSWRKYFSSAINLECEKGDIVIFDGRMLHRGLKNQSAYDRPMIIATMSQYGFTNDFQLD